MQNSQPGIHGNFDLPHAEYSVRPLFKLGLATALSLASMVVVLHLRPSPEHNSSPAQPSLYPTTSLVDANNQLKVRGARADAASQAQAVAMQVARKALSR